MWQRNFKQSFIFDKIQKNCYKTKFGNPLENMPF